MFKMDCGCYYNNREFKVGRKYLTVSNIATGEEQKIQLTDEIKSKLKEIKDCCDAYSAARTKQVLDLFDEYAG